MGALRVEAVEVLPAEVVARVRVTDLRFMRTSASQGVAERALEALPGLGRHRCESGHAKGIASELGDTETPHLLEHVALELMALAGSPRTLAGRTTWDFARDGRGVFEVRLQFDDDLAALAALDEGRRVVDELLGGAVPETEAAVCRVRDARAR